jgi:hypothetical protein
MRMRLLVFLALWQSSFCQEDAVPEEVLPEGSCSAEENTCQSAGQKSPDAEEIEEDGMAKDIKKLCPIAETPVSPMIRSAIKLLKSMTGTLQFLRLWPAGVSPEKWADYYFVANYVIVARISLGLYKTRNKDWVNIPQGQLDNQDLAHVENIYAPHYDVDGSPNFFWFEGALPSFVMKQIYTPMVTCFYSSLRKLGLEDASLLGKFADDLDDPVLNTWAAALNNTNFKRPFDWVMHFYNNAKSWDGFSLWPQQMTNFQTYFRQDQWDDELEHAVAFHLIGSHRLESGSWTFKDVAGAESVVLPFRLPLNSFKVLAVRPSFGRYGVDLYFNADGLPVLLETTDGKIVTRGDKDWQYWKFVWRSTLITGITLVDHLHLTHFRAATIFSRSTRTALPPEHPFRRVLAIFTFGSIFVNMQAMHQLAGPKHMLHRATPFKDFTKLSRIVPEMLDDFMDIPGLKALYDEGAWSQLHPTLQASPYYSDGRLLMDILRKFSRKIQAEMGACQPDGKFEPSFEAFKQEVTNETLQGNYKFPHGLFEHSSCTELMPWLFDRLAVYLFVVTGWHRHVGFVGDYYGDPSLATMSWKEGEAIGRPRQHMIMTVVNVFTSTRQPLLKEDYTHLFQDLEPKFKEPFTRIWKELQADLAELEAEVDRRNVGRKVLNHNMSPKFLESAVSK